MGVTDLVPWGAVSAVQAASATASNDALTVTAEGDGVLAVRSVGSDFHIIVSDGSATPTITLEARGGTLASPPPGSPIPPLPFDYEVTFPANPTEESSKGTVRRVYVKVDLIADTNRNGVIDEDDQDGKDEWTHERGTIYNVNFDRDGTTNNLAGLPMPDAIHFNDGGLPNFEHYAIVNEVDEADIAPLKIRLMVELPPDFSVYLCVDEEESMRAMHLYKRIQAGDLAIWGSCKPPHIVPAPWAAM